MENANPLLVIVILLALLHLSFFLFLIVHPDGLSFLTVEVIHHISSFNN